jgi:hypothetical protein
LDDCEEETIQTGAASSAVLPSSTPIASPTTIPQPNATATQEPCNTLI